MPCAVEMDVFCEPSQGAVDFPALRDLLSEIDYDGWAVVVQDIYPAPFDKPLPIARHTAPTSERLALVKRQTGQPLSPTIQEVVPW